MQDLIIALDLSTPQGTQGTLAAASMNGSIMEVLLEQTVGAEGDHCSGVIPTIDAALHTLGASKESIKRMMIPTGPGSFTGLRLGFATAKAFALSWGITIDLVDGAEVRAIQWAQTHSESAEKTICTVTFISRSSCLFNSYTTDSFRNVTLTQESQMTLADAEQTLLKTVDNILWDERSFTAKTLSTGVLFPLRANLLIRARPHAKTLQELSEFSQIAAASPRYPGSKF